MIAALAIISCKKENGSENTPSDTPLTIGMEVEGGMVYYIDPLNPQAGKIIELTMAEELTWSDLGETTGAVSRTDGVANTAAIMASEHYPENYPAMMHCEALGEGWYMPAIEEWQEIYDLWNGGGDKNIANETARAAFDLMLTDLGGTPMNPNPETTQNGQSYWSSTEMSDNNANAYYLRFGNWAEAGAVKRSTARLTRCIKTVGTLSPVPTLVFADNIVSLPAAAGSTGSVSFTSNQTEFSIEVDEEAAEWCEATISGNSVTVKALTANDGSTPRTATIRVTAGPEALHTTASLIVSQATSVVFESHVGEFMQGGVVFWQNPEDPTQAKILSPNRLSGKPWCERSEQDVLTGADSRTDGIANTEKILALPNADKYYAAQYCKSMGEGWYLPAKDEMLEIFAAYNGVSSWELADKGTPANIPAEQRAARAAFDKVLTDNGGVIMNSQADDKNGESYWSSTEDPNDVQKVYYLRCGALDNNTMAKRGSARFVRCVKYITIP